MVKNINKYLNKEENLHSIEKTFNQTMEAIDLIKKEIE